MRKIRGWLITLSVFLLLSVFMGSMFYVKMRDAQRKLSIVYDRAFEAATGTMEEVSLNLEKLAFCKNGAESAKLLESVSRGADCVLRALSVLPASEENLPEVLAFANKLSEYADALNRKAMGGEIPENDWAQMEQLSAQGDRLRMVLQNTDAASMIAAAESDAETDLYADFTSEEEPVLRLIYDGAFSDAAKTEPKNLGTGAITAGDAEQAAAGFAGGSAEYEGEVGGDIPCYLFRVTDGEDVRHVQVTKTGKIYLMTTENVSGENVLSMEECKEKAAQFLKEKGFCDMEPAYTQIGYGVATVNFVATQDDVWLYPDQIKVQVSANDGRVVGFEANNYLRNHEKRTFPEEILQEKELEPLISAFDEVENIRLSVIPHFSSEVYCYEIRGEKDGETFLLYLNAESGEAEDVLKLILNESGEAVI